MKITDHTNKNKKPFSDLDKGCVFKKYGMIFMKIDDVIDELVQLPSNAVNLMEGETVFFCADTTVEVVDCELIIGGAK